MNAALTVSSIDWRDETADGWSDTPHASAKRPVGDTGDERRQATPHPMAAAIALGRASLKLSISTSTARNSSTGTNATMTLATIAISGAPSARPSPHDAERHPCSKATAPPTDSVRSSVDSMFRRKSSWPPMSVRPCGGWPLRRGSSPGRWRTRRAAST